MLMMQMASDSQKGRICGSLAIEEQLEVLACNFKNKMQ